MSTGTPLLNDDGTASMATFFMSSHQGFRRDLLHLGRALDRLASGDRSAAGPVSAYWKRFHEHLHGHHTVEDSQMFPSMSAATPHLAATFTELGEQHRRIDPLLAAGDAAFEGGISDPAAARRIVTELAALLDGHLTTEEQHVIPMIRGANEFPPPPDDAAAALYAQGFAWSLHGLHADVVARVYDRLPAALVAKLPEAQRTFAADWAAAFGPLTGPGTRTSHPDA